MAHEMTVNDRTINAETGNWHMFNTTVKPKEDGILTVQEAIENALNWGIIQKPIFTQEEVDGETRLVQIPGRVANIRSDTREVLSDTTDGYHPLQNLGSDGLQGIAEDFNRDGIVQVETCGSIRGGRRVYLTLRAASFAPSARPNDEIIPYILLANGNDGILALKAIPTTVRVVCSNTLHAALNDGKLGYSFRHTVNILDRVREVQKAMRVYETSLEQLRAKIDVLAVREVNKADIQEFFHAAYERDFGIIPAATVTKKTEINAREKAMDAYNEVCKNFDAERNIAGTTGWNMFNAYSNMVQKKGINSKNPDAVMESNVFGKGADFTLAAFDQALAMV